jgi:hypothetical protein
MNTKLLLLAMSVAAFSSCTTLYKSGQTPDDVYYSPTRLTGYGEERKEPQREVVNNYNYNSQDRAIRFGITDPRWRYLDNNYSNNLYINDYSYTPYNYGFNYGYYYNPYFWPYPVYGSVFVTPSVPKITTPRIANLGGYNQVYNNTRVNTTHGGTRPVRNYNNNNNGSAVGNVIRQIFSPSNSNTSNSTNNSSSNNNRTYTPSTSSSSSSSGSSSSGSGGGVSRPPRN